MRIMEHRESTRQTRGVCSIDSAGQVDLPRHLSLRACARLPIRRLVLLFGGAAVLGGCVLSTTTIESGAPLDRAALSQIRLGETTGTEVMRLLGPPHSIIRGSASFREASSLDYHTRYQRLSGHGYYSYAQDRQLSSFDDEHYILFYKYGKVKARSTALLITGIAGRRDVRFQGEELLIVVDTDRDVVTDVASRLDYTSP